MSARSPSLAQVMRQALDSRVASLRVSMPGRIESFDAAKQLASVKPLLQETHENEEGTDVIDSLPIITNVPVYSQSGQNYAITMPIGVGDSCLLVFSDRSLDVWNSLGGEVDPVDPRRHDLSDAVCFVGVKSGAGALGEYDPAAVQIGSVGGPRVRVSASTVSLGALSGIDGAQAAVKGTALQLNTTTAISALQAQITAAVAGLATATGGVGATATGITAAAVPNAIPLVGGILALPGFLAAVAGLATVATGLGALSAAIGAMAAPLSVYDTSFNSGPTGNLSSKVKLE